jgi:tetratricopeptide (TPR) repeat protein
LGGAGVAAAQNINLKDGTVVATKGIVRRAGDMIMARVERQMPPPPAGQAPATPPIDEVGYAVQKIEKIEFPEPPQLKGTAQLLGQGKVAEALTYLEPAYKYYEGFHDAPGSWWRELAVLKASALITLGNDRDAASLADQMTRFAAEPETGIAARAMSAALMSRKGEHGRALEIFEAVMKEGNSPEVLALSAIYKGQSHLALKQWDPAMLSFLQLPVFYPEAKFLLPASRLGVGLAFSGMPEREHAKEVLNDVIKTFPASAEAAKAKEELAAIAKIEKILAEP